MIRHSDVEAKPRPRTIYRCSVCRLELQLNTDTDRLDVVPLTDDDLNDPRRAPNKAASD